MDAQAMARLAVREKEVLMRSAICIVLAAACLVLFGGSSAVAQDQKFSTNAYTLASDHIEVIIDTTASRISKAQPYLALAVTVRNLQKAPIELTAESFALQQGDMRLPVAGWKEIETEYHRQSSNLRMEETFIGQIRGYYTGQSLVRMSLFPSRQSPYSARQGLTLNGNQVGYGFIYFKLPEKDALGEGDVQVLVIPTGMSPLPLDISVYRHKK